ncbi:unnamed protein product [Phaedon cochleariae]|uniref:Uncharacterized protein n=1 Tax=Phaedon cochleariae TaxID=80249 RepID=A0A9N9X1Z1_PHACE|nr:unnamed protein product [Phaedon cochleariae]
MSEIANLMPPDHRIASVRHYEAAPPPGLELLSFMSQAPDLAVTRELGLSALCSPCFGKACHNVAICPIKEDEDGPNDPSPSEDESEMYTVYQ